MAQEQASIALPNKDLPETGSDSAKNYRENLNYSKLLTMVKFLTATKQLEPGSAQPSRDIRSASLTTAKDEEIFGWIGQSDQNDWERDPAFYEEIIIELKKRGIIQAQVGDRL